MWYNKKPEEARKINNLSIKFISKGGNYGTELDLKNHTRLKALFKNFLSLFPEKSTLPEKNDLPILPETTNSHSANSLRSYFRSLPAAKARELT